MCASYEYELYMCFDLCHAIFTEVYAMYFLIYVVTSPSMQIRLRDVADSCDFVIPAKSESVIFCCHLNLLTP